LRGPLTAVKGYAQLALIAARKDATFPDRSRRALFAIDHQSSRMADMLAEMLDAARIQRGAFEVRPRMMELNLSVKHIVDQRRLALEEQHTIELDAGHDVLVGLWDAPRVEQIVRDLLDNALRYSPEGGAIAVSLARAGASARLCVRDEGIGVRADERERIFEPFFRGAVARQRHLSGLGLGLFVGHTVAERLGGRLTLDPLPPGETGSRFCLELPLAGV
jgi:signal transduction histidine kinase